MEGAGLLEVVDVTGARDDYERGMRDRVLELAYDAARRGGVRVALDQQLALEIRDQIAGPDGAK